MIKITRTPDSNFLKLTASTKIFSHLSDLLMARDKNCYFHPSYKKKMWDGNIRFLQYNGLFQAGLLVEVLRIAKKNKWAVEYEQNLIINDKKFEASEVNLSLNGVDLYDDTQFPHVEKLLKFKIGMAKLPTSLGKSYIEISMMNLYYLKGIKQQILIVPRASLVEQIYKDIIDKSRFIPADEVGRLYGSHKSWNKNIVIATWQSLNILLQLDPAFGKRFELLIQDEVHVSSVSAKVVKKIINSFNPTYKYGFSATILSKDKNKLEYLNLVSLFGVVVVKDTIQNLQEKNRISKSEIHVKVLKYLFSTEINDYSEYEEFIRYSQSRRKYIENLVSDIREKDKKGNILILIRNVDFAKQVKEEYAEKFGIDNVHLISGDVKIENRIKIKEDMKERDGLILIATTGTFSIGENVPNLHYLILCQSRKSEIEIVQQIGRTLRKHDGKKTAVIYDIVDDLIVIREKINEETGKVIKIKKNFGKLHMKKRIEVFKDYGFIIKDIETKIL